MKGLPPPSDTRSTRRTFDAEYSRYHDDPGYRARDSSAYDRLNVEDLWRRVRQVLSRLPGSPARVLEIGCSGGASLDRMRRETAAPVVIGVDIRRSALATAREAAIGSTLIETDCLPIPFRDGSFDVIFQFTTFSSIPETDAKVRIAREILRVLATGGVFLWYDMRYPNPGNRFTRCETRATIGHYFPGTDFHLESMTLIPQIGRWIYPSRPRLGGLLGRLAGLHSHYFGWFLKG